MAQSPAPVDLDLAHRRARQALDRLSRDGALALAVNHADRKRVGWVRRAWVKRTLEARCCGLFRLVNPERPDLPWPSVVFLVRDDRDVCALFLYHGPDGKWTVLDEGETDAPDGSRRVALDPGQFAGNPDGPPSLFNGDGEVIPERPAEAPEASPDALDEPEEPLPASDRPRKTRRGRSRVASASTRKESSSRTDPARSPRPLRKSPAPSKRTERVDAPDAPRTPSSDTTPLSPREEIVLRLLRLLDGS